MEQRPVGRTPWWVALIQLGCGCQTVFFMVPLMALFPWFFQDRPGRGGEPAHTLIAVFAVLPFALVVLALLAEESVPLLGPPLYGAMVPAAAALVIVVLALGTGAYVEDAFMMVFALLLAFIGFACFELSRQVAPRLLRSPLRGTARILDVRDTGAATREKRILELRLRVEVPGREPYDALRRVAVKDEDLLQEGRVYRCAVSRKRPHRLNMIWKRVVEDD
ncbi:hypothetical protein ACIBF1_27955 [Spirillospora sp. NPDC050679]